MADFVIACTRPGRPSPFDGSVLERCAARLRPPGADSPASRRHDETGLSLVLVGAVDTGSVLKESAVAVGCFFGSPGMWWLPGSEPPDGTYALCRSDERRVELVSDATASRTIWYALDDAAFLASTSQRALVQLLGSFVPDHEVVAWMLTSGTLGPSGSWDARIRRLPGDSIVTLDRRAWKMTLVTRPADFTPEEGTAAAQRGRLGAAIDETCSGLDLEGADWRLALSGGLDSRLILAVMARAGRAPRCLTWASARAQRSALSDASVARLVALRCGARHDTRTVEYAREPADDVLSRFVVVGEGRTDHVEAYVDGLETWRSLCESGVAGVIRGDESCGSRNCAPTPTDARLVEEAPMVGDYGEEHLVRRLGLAEQHWPDHLELSEGESLDTYRHRLNQQFYVPVVLGALNELKGRYVEIVNPLLSRPVVRATQRLTDSQRRDAKAYVDIALASCWPIPAARSSALAPAEEYLARPGTVTAMVRELSSPQASQVLGPDAVAQLLGALEVYAAEPVGRATQVRRLAKFVLPTRAAIRLTPPFTGPPPLNAISLAFRAYIASRMASVLSEDATALEVGGP